jgi:predicted amidohydrolase YtcJ
MIALDTDGAWLAEVVLDQNHTGNRIQSLQKLEKAREQDFAQFPVLSQGFYDSHMHPTWMAKLKSQLLCRKKTAREIIDSLSKDPQNRIYGYGWNDDDLGQTLESFAQNLEKLEKEIILFRVCGHMAYVSTLARKAFKIEGSSHYLKETELEQIPRPELRSDDMRAALDEIHAKGIDEVPELLLRIKDYEVARSFPELLLFADVKSVDQFPRANSQLRYMKYFLDGTFGARSAWLREKFSDSDTLGIQNWSDAELESSIRKSLERGFLVAFHAIGDAALDQVLRIGEKLKDELAKSVRENFFHRIEHLQLCHDDQIEKLQNQKFWTLGLQPSHRVMDAGFVEHRLGEERMRSAYRLRSFTDAGLRVSLGSDAPIAPFDPEITFRSILTDPRSGERLSASEIYTLFCVRGRQNAGIAAKKLEVGSKAWLSKLTLEKV